MIRKHLLTLAMSLALFGIISAPSYALSGTPQTPAIQFEVLDFDQLPLGLSENGTYLIPQGTPFYVRIRANAGEASVNFIHFRLFLPGMNHPPGWTPPGMLTAGSPDSQRTGAGPHIFGPFYTTAQNSNEIQSMFGQWHYDMWVHTSAFQDGRVGMGYNYLHSVNYPRAHEFSWRGGDASNRSSPPIIVFNNNRPNAFISVDKLVMYADETLNINTFANDPDGNLRSILLWESFEGSNWWAYNQASNLVEFPPQAQWMNSLPNSANGFAFTIATGPRNRYTLEKGIQWTPHKGHGTYTFQVIGVDNGGLMSTPRQVTVTVYLVPTITELSYTIPNAIQNNFPADNVLLTAVVRSDRPGSPQVQLSSSAITYRITGVNNLFGSVSPGLTSPSFTPGGIIPNDTGDTFGTISVVAEFPGDGTIFGPSTSLPAVIPFRNPSFDRHVQLKAFPPQGSGGWFTESPQEQKTYHILRPR